MTDQKVKQLPLDHNNPDVNLMSAITSKGGIRNKKIIAYLEKWVYPDLKIALQ